MPNYPTRLDRRPRPNQPGGRYDPVAFGQRIRSLRKAADLTLEEVSASSGISRAGLSKIERGEMSPTYETLLKLARGLRTDLATLVSGRRPTVGGYDVTRAGKGAEYSAEGFAHKLLAPGLPERALFAFVTEVHATNLEKHGAFNKHDSEDFLYVLEGAVAIYLAEGKPIELQRGDSMQMDGRIPHALIALPSERKGRTRKPVARLLWVTAPFA